MQSEIDEIIRVLVVLGGGKTSSRESESLLERLFEKTDENERNVYFSSNKKELISRFETCSSKVVAICKEDSCKLCPIRKWCNHYRIISQRIEKRRRAFVFADFFCGSGGLSLGFEQEGFKLSLANDIQTCCINTYTFNHPEVPSKHIIAGDIDGVICNLKDKLRFDEVDVVIGGPPCQGFSRANRQRLIDDPRNHLYKSYIKAVECIKPKFVVMENVRGILNHADQIREDFMNIGYDVSVRILNAKDFGVPQNRERAIFIGNRVGIDNRLVFDRIGKCVSKREKSVLKHALYGLPRLEAKRIKNHTEIETYKTGYTIAKGNGKTNPYIDLINCNQEVQVLYNHKARYNNERDIEIFSLLNQGDDSSDAKISEIMPYKRRNKIFKDKYFKLDESKECKTITAHMKYDCNMYIHPRQARGLTPREAARIQSYPDDYFFKGPYTMTYMQVGNSVPPLLSRVIAKAIKKFLKENN